jgi:tripartite-type tricarboxylate transporter receptor subunit TctC
LDKPRHAERGRARRSRALECSRRTLDSIVALVGVRPRLAALLAAAIIVCSEPANAVFPERSITLVVAASPGGGIDSAARLVAKGLGESLHQPVVIANRPGAYSRNAYDAVVHSPPDGHTLLVTTATAAIDIAIDPKASPNALDDFMPVSTLAITDLVLVVSPSLPARSVKELIDVAREAPGRLNFSTPGAGTPYHLEGELFKARTGIDIVHVPYKGLVQALAALVSGDVQMTFSSLPAALPLVQAGKLRALAVASPARSPLLPDVPTMTQSGVDDVDTAVWYGIFAPSGTPRDVVDTLNTTIRNVSRSPDYQKTLLALGATPFVTSPDEFGRMLHAEVAKWSRVVTAAKLHLR